jgi:hypothetical protein
MRKYRSISEVYTSGITYKNIDIPKYRQSQKLHDAYSLVYEAVNHDVLSAEAIESITGVNADIIINYYRYIRANGTLKYVLDNVKMSVGTPVYRAVNQDLHGDNYHALSKFVKEVSVDREDPFKITTAGLVKKLRTSSGGRVCAWEPGDNKIDQLSDPASYPIEKIKNINLYRVLAIVHLLHEHHNNIIQVDKMPPGISYEIDQINTFDKNLEGLPPIGFILPGTNELYRDNDGQVVLIDGVRNVEKTPKADMALTLNDDEVFWISYKHGEYIEDVTKPSHIPFQQYGSPGGIYGDEDLKPVVDKFLTTVSSTIGNYYSRDDIIEIGEKNEDAPKGSLEKLMNVYGKQLSKRRKSDGKLVQNFFNKHKVDHFHMFPSGTPEIGAKLFDQHRKPLGGKLDLLGLKSIYGDEYDGNPNTPFSEQNVNILLQTPQSAKFEIMTGTPMDPDEPIAIRMTMVEKSHIIKNPDLPDSVPYLPCMYIRHTTENYFIFKNTKTNRIEAIIGGRLLVYPQGSVSNNSTWVDIFDE